MSEFLSKQRRNTARGASACLWAALIAATPVAFAASKAPPAASATPAFSNGETGDPVSALRSADTLPQNFTGDDPEHVRDALRGHLGHSSGTPSITSRVRNLLEHPIQSIRKGSPASTTRISTDQQAARTFLFVIPASYGVRYESKRKLLSVNVSLASPDQPNGILLKQTVKGQSGRKLVIAPEAKAKGFIQTFDTILLQTDNNTPTTVKGNVRGPTLTNARNGDFAIVLVCTLEPPYLTEDVEHTEPSEEEPTDITRRTSSLQGIVNEVWLIDRKDGTIVSKQLRLAK